MDRIDISRLARRARRFLPFLGLVLFALALWAIHLELKHHSYAQILQAIHGIGTSSLLEALGLTGLSFLILSFYDLLAVRAVGSKLGYRFVALASFLGYAFSQALGYSVLTGIPIRFRLYTSWGLSAVEVTRVVGSYTFTFWLGLATVGGTVGLVEPGLAVELLHIDPVVARVFGLLLLTPVATYALWSGRAQAPLRIWSLELPSPGILGALTRILVGAMDWFVAGLVFWVLLPDGSGISVPYFLGAFFLAQTLGILSNIPGGIGVFEAALLFLLPASLPNPDALAAMVAYRVIYYLVPLILAALGLGAYEALLRKEAVAKATAAVRVGATAVVPLVMSMAIFAAGASLLVTGAIPVPRDELEWLASFVPLPFIEASHFLGSVVGTWLLILAWGLQRRLDGAYHLTAVLLGVGAVLAVTKGTGIWHAGSLLVLLLVLWAARREFYRKASLTTEPLTPAWTAALLATLLATVWIGFFAYKEVAYSGELWWKFTLSDHAPRFLRASVGGLVVLVVFGLRRLLRPALPSQEPEEGKLPDEVPELALGSPRTLAQLALLGDKAFLLSQGRQAFLMYRVKGRSWVVLGDPVGEEEEYPELVWQFRNLVHRHDGWPVFFQVTPTFLPLYLDAGLTLLKIGEEGRVYLPEFSLEGRKKGGLRSSCRRVEREGGSFEIVPRDRVAAVLPELKEVSDVWLEEKATREKSFSLGSFSREYLEWAPVAVVRVDGRVAAFASLMGTGGGVELAPDLMRYRADSPNGTMEYLFVQMMEWGAQAGFRWFSLGMAPLSGLETGPVASLWNRFGATVFRHGEHFYNFQGLRAYKEKFGPVWEPRYLASPGGPALPFILTNLTTLISGGIVGTLTK